MMVLKRSGQRKTIIFGLIFSCFFPSFGLIGPERASALANNVALTPVMGWNSWNTFRYNVTDMLIREVVDAMDANGMKAAGYQFVNIDAGWWDNNLGPTGNGRDANGNIIPNAERFPNGMKAVVDYIHSKGFKAGIYTDIGPTGCGVAHGSYGYYEKDAQQFADWGFDLVKVDVCGGGQGAPHSQRYAEFRDAILATGRPMIFSICEGGFQKAWQWGTDVGNYWRINVDIDYQGTLWNGVVGNIDISKNLANFAGPGHFNDMDMLVVGVTSHGDGSVLTDTEAKAHFSMWSILTSPLLAGNDVRNMPTNIGNILKNTEVIAVNQDPLGKQGVLVEESTIGLQVYAKTLQGSGARAVVLFNKTAAAANMTVNAAALGLSGSFTARDLWPHTDLGTQNGSYTVNVPSHGAVMLKVQGTELSHSLANAGFDNESGTQSPSGWLESGSNPEASYSEVFGSAHNGTLHGTHFKSSAYQVYTYQLKTGLPNGSYNLSAWVKSSGGQATARMQAANYGGAQLNANIPAGTSWKQITIRDIPVTNGQLEVGFYSNALANQWIYFDDVRLDANVSTITPGIYKLINRNSGKLLDIANASSADMAITVQWGDNGGNNQLWNVVKVGSSYKLIALCSGKALDLFYSNPANLAPIGQYTDNGGANQRWNIINTGGGGYYKLLNGSSGKALTVDNLSMSDGTAVIQWEDNGGINAQWSLVSAY